jgi:hypothetical protein
MYKAIYRIQPDCIDEKENKIFTPFLNCYEVHSVFVNSGGLIEDALSFDGNYTYIKTLYIHDKSFRLTFDINYFYMNLNNTNIFDYIIDSKYKDPHNSKKIAAKHYIEGQFSLDNGLYKNAILNFGTTLECLLNKNLNGWNFKKLIEQYEGSASKDEMHSIRDLRNKVHPNRITDMEDINQSDAIEVRNKLEVILKKFTT